MRIGIDARIAHYSRGGIRSYVVQLLSALAALEEDMDYLVLHSRKGRDISPSASDFHPVPCWTPSHHRFERWTLSIEIARWGIDLLHSPDSIPPAFGYSRSVITVHDLNYLYYPRFLTDESRRYYRGQIEWAVQRAEHILADSHATKADLMSLLGVPSERVSVYTLLPIRVFVRFQRRRQLRRRSGTVWTLASCSLWARWSRERTSRGCFRPIVCSLTRR